MILEENNKHQLVLIPKKHAKIVFEKISFLKHDNNDVSTNSKLYYFESLTYRALRKLCFGVNGNFLPEIEEEFKHEKIYLTKVNGTFGEHCFRKSENPVEIDEPKLINFYQEVLKTNFVKNNLKLPENVIKEVAEKQYKNLDEFKIALEKCCYKRHKIISEEMIKDIIKHYEAKFLNITSIDLRKESKTKNKAHTDFWLNFWKQENEDTSFPQRLNPEVSIFWRNFDECQKNDNRHSPNKRYRYLQPQFTLATTFTDNALNTEISLAFKNTKEKGNQVIEFNKKLNPKLKTQLDKKQLWFYGIDSGEIEFATLSLMDSDNLPKEFTAYEIKKDSLNYSKKGYLYNKGNPIIRENPYKVISNPSYFLDRALYEKTFRDGKFKETFDTIFKKKENITCLDLTTAKVISEKIIINGDITSLLNAKLLHAKRKIYQKLIKDSKVELSYVDYKIYIKNESDKNKKPIYQSRTFFEGIKPYSEIKELLENYCKDKQCDTARTEEQINNYRRAMAGNMVGVINHLYQTFPGIISIEDFKQSKIESDRLSSEGSIARPLEWALYRKLQQTGLVPPISELIKLREIEEFNNTTAKYDDIHINQFGIIVFVSEKDTSINCPSCGKKGYENSEDVRYCGNGKQKGDKQKGIFDCKNKECKWRNKTNFGKYVGLENNDCVAAFNIAKRGFNKINNSK